MRILATLLAMVAGLLVVRPAAAADDPSGVFAQGVRALRDGRVSDAIGAFEQLADLGVVDAAASYDRGLAYATRVRIGAEVPGDLGRAAQGFEEARDLTRNPRLADDAARALTLVRSEVARRRIRAGDPVEVDPGPTLARTLARLLDENVWAWLSVASSAALALGLFLRWLGRAPRLRVGGGVAAGVAAPALLLSVAVALAARHDRLWLREGVVVTAGARPGDERGITLPGATPLPEGARVEMLEARGGRTRVRFGSIDAWVPASALRGLAR